MEFTGPRSPVLIPREWECDGMHEYDQKDSNYDKLKDEKPWEGSDKDV